MYETRSDASTAWPGGILINPETRHTGFRLQRHAQQDSPQAVCRLMPSQNVLEDLPAALVQGGVINLTNLHYQWHWYVRGGMLPVLGRSRCCQLLLQLPNLAPAH